MSGDADAPLPEGTVFGRYVITRLIGRGGMGCVYEATHTQLRKRVALKTLNASAASTSGVVSRFVREGEAAARIRHPHVVDVTDVGVENDIPYLVMEFLEGEDLSAMLDRGPLDEHLLADLLIPIMAAVHAAHAEGIVHRDLKPGNIFLTHTRQGTIQPKLVDFGISKVHDLTSRGGLTTTKEVLGTPYYMAPEQVQDAKHVDALTDQYSLGVILYQCATGRLPFEGDQLYPLLHAIVQGDFAPPRALRPDLSPELDAIILRAMSRDPRARFPSVAELARALLPLASPMMRAAWEHELSGTVPLVHVPSLPALPRLGRTAFETTRRFDTAERNAFEARLATTTRPRRRQRALIAIGVAAVGAVALSATFLVLRQRGPVVASTSAAPHLTAEAPPPPLRHAPDAAAAASAPPSPAPAPSVDLAGHDAAAPREASAPSHAARGRPSVGRPTPSAAARGSEPPRPDTSATVAAPPPPPVSASARTGVNDAPILR